MQNKDVITETIKDSPSHPKKTTTQESKIIQLIVFNLGNEEFSTDVDQVREIIVTGSITPIPDSPPFIKGMTNVRGEIVLIIDLRAQFFLSSKEGVESKHIVITRQKENPFGFMVDEVTEVLRVSETEISPVPTLVTIIDKRYISGVLTFQNRLITLLDLNKVLSEEELLRLAETSKKHISAEETAPAENSDNSQSTRDEKAQKGRMKDTKKRKVNKNNS